MASGDQTIQAIPPEDLQALRGLLSNFLQKQFGQPKAGYPYPMAAGPTPAEQYGAGIIGRLAGIPSGVNPIASPFMGVAPQAPGQTGATMQDLVAPFIKSFQGAAPGMRDVPPDVTGLPRFGRTPTQTGTTPTRGTQMGTQGIAPRRTMGGPGYNFRPQGGLTQMQTPQGQNRLQGDYWNATEMGMFPWMLKNWR